LIEALGAESINYDLKLECCGNPVEKTDKELSLLITKNKLEAMKNSGANCICLVCPACFQQFDFNQRKLSKNIDSNYNFPVFYLSELIALAFGYLPKDLGMRYHRVRPEKLLERLKFSL
ncbi:MAG: CoB--CoM heterodisulfide reductase subunit B, partial [Candidatus Lokiarchaeota archaeon]|nr:CoB--CoM heterodisulfide reductase subunit B [Candidatus Lokiarchaeota archaeon]MBD3337918.1 CoB--CoM heterodisulfide reductase subunit B [Candidatus Lokiarchaeota archaeon]